MVSALGTGHFQSECDGLTHIYIVIYEKVFLFSTLLDFCLTSDKCLPDSCCGLALFPSLQISIRSKMLSLLLIDLAQSPHLGEKIPRVQRDLLLIPSSCAVIHLQTQTLTVPRCVEPTPVAYFDWEIDC